MNKLIRKLRSNEAGVTAIEYGLIAALIAAVLITVLTSLGTDLKAKFQSIESSVAGAGNG